MAQVPYTGAPSVSPSGQAAPNISINAPADAFGAAWAEGMKQFGHGVEKAGNELFERAVAIQQLANDAEAKEADAKFTIELGKLHAEYNSLQGKDAVAAYPKYAEDVQALRAQIGDGLSSPQARKLYDSASKSMAARTIFNGAGYAATQNKAYLYGASRARVDAAVDQFYQNPDDDLSFRRTEATVRAEAKQQGDIKGWSPEQVAEVANKDVSRMWLNRITGLANTRPFEAKEILDKNRGKLHGDDLRKAETIVENRGHNAGARIISESVLRPIYSSPEGAKEKSLEELVQAGERLAEKQFPDDPLMKGFVRDRIRVDYTAFKTIRRETTLKNEASVLEAISGKVTGKRLISEDEIRASSPAVASAWDALPETKRKSLRKDLLSNARGDYLETPENHERYNVLKGMAALEPNKFIEQTDAGFGEMPRKWSDELMNKRIALLKRQDADPRVSSAIRAITQKYGDAVPKKADDETKYYGFVGAIQGMMAEYEEEYKKPMPFKEKMEMGAFLLQNIPNKYMPDWLSKPDRFYQQIPKAVEKLKEDPRWKAQGIQPPSDETLRQIVIRDLYQRAYQKQKAKNKDQDQMLKGTPIGGAKDE